MIPGCLPLGTSCVRPGCFVPERDMGRLYLGDGSAWAPRPLLGDNCPAVGFLSDGLQSGVRTVAAAVSIAATNISRCLDWGPLQLRLGRSVDGQQEATFNRITTLELQYLQHQTQQIISSSSSNTGLKHLESTLNSTRATPRSWPTGQKRIRSPTSHPNIGSISPSLVVIPSTRRRPRARPSPEKEGTRPAGQKREIRRSINIYRAVYL